MQNAEDAGATETTFILTEAGLAFEHNGRPFEPRDIEAITDIGEGTKANDDDKIGRFGIGFKAVFAYTETPRIWSSNFAFEISDLVLPFELPPKAHLGNVTRFEFPFNNPKKSAANACAEIEKGLHELPEMTLLFLSRIESIEWELPENGMGGVFRFPHSEHHVEVFKKSEGKTTSSAHYLRFTAPVQGLEKQRIAIAFQLDFLPKANGYDTLKPLAEQFRIVPANPGRVAVFFPAEKETSGLRFHLHAPFVPELSRASIKETPANTPLYRQLAHLVASSLHSIKGLSLLTADFLSALPNPQDDVPNRYADIRQAIIGEMNDEPLTPTYSKEHAPAKHLLQARASLKTLLSPEDLKTLVEGSENAPQWAIGAAQKYSAVDRFLSGLAIREWDVPQFVALLGKRASDEYRWDPSNNRVHQGTDKSFIAWLAAKPDDWFQKFYALLADDCLTGPEYAKKRLLEKLKPLHIIRLSSGGYTMGSRCFFPTDEVEEDEVLPRVAKGVFTSGKQKIEQESAINLLEALGVRHVGEAEQVEAILKQRYCNIDFSPSKHDLNRFIALVEEDAGQAVMFKDYLILKGEDGKGRLPRQVYLDMPYLETGLMVYYNALGDKADRVALSREYQEYGLSTKRLVDFARLVGVAVELTIDEVSCEHNPKATTLGYRPVPHNRGSKHRIDKDYMISGLDQILERENESLSRLIWQTCSNASSPNWILAQYRNNISSQWREAPSQLAVLLQNKKWIPQRCGAFVIPAEADRDRLPDGFAFDPGWSWLRAIGFGESIAKQSTESRRKLAVALELGFNDDESLNDAKWFGELDPEERKRFKKQYESKHLTDLPEHEPSDPERRTKLVREEAAEAPERITELRTRSVSVGRDSVKKETDSYLRHQYTIDDKTICQVCKAALPFKLPDGRYYLEAVEFLPMKRRHFRNYLTLCPNHAAMFKHANGCSQEMMKVIFLDMDANESKLEVMLADEKASIYFTKTHIKDIRDTILEDNLGATEEELAPSELLACSSGNSTSIILPATVQRPGVIEAHPGASKRLEAASTAATKIETEELASGEPLVSSSGNSIFAKIKRLVGVHR